MNNEANRALLTALACGASVESAARKAGISERTAYRRRADPEFQKQLAELQAEMIQRTSNLLTSASLGSVKTLVDLQQNESTKDGVRRGAARDILELAPKYREVVAFEKRLAALEQRPAA